MVEYTLKEISNPNDILPLLTEQKDPQNDMKKNIPTGLLDEDKKNEVMVAIQQQRIKLYVNLKMELETKMPKMYGLIKGQCSYSLTEILKQEKDYDRENRGQDVLWLMERLKSLTSDIVTFLMHYTH